MSNLVREVEDYQVGQRVETTSAGIVPKGCKGTVTELHPETDRVYVELDEREDRVGGRRWKFRPFNLRSLESPSIILSDADESYDFSRSSHHYTIYVDDNQVGFYSHTLSTHLILGTVHSRETAGYIAENAHHTYKENKNAADIISLITKTIARDLLVNE